MSDKIHLVPLTTLISGGLALSKLRPARTISRASVEAFAAAHTHRLTGAGPATRGGRGEQGQ